MSDEVFLYLSLRWLHILGAAVLLGTGAGIAFFMLMAHRTRDAALVAHTAGVVVVADFVFTLTAVVAQPVTGYLLVERAGWAWSAGWVQLSLALYVLTGLFWLPVVWIQLRMRDLACAALRDDEALPQTYHRLYGAWFVCGFPAFAAVLGILYLMVFKPQFSLLG